MRLDGLHHSRSEAQPTDGANGGIDLQLVEHLHTHGQRTQSPRGGHHAAAVSKQRGAPNATRQSDDIVTCELAWQGEVSGQLTAQDQRLVEDGWGMCGAVTQDEIVALDIAQDLRGVGRIQVLGIAIEALFDAGQLPDLG